MEDFYKFYIKLKIYFCVFCVVNVIIIFFVCGFFVVFFVWLLDNDMILDNFWLKLFLKVGDNVLVFGKIVVLFVIMEFFIV